MNAAFVCIIVLNFSYLQRMGCEDASHNKLSVINTLEIVEA